MSREVSLRFKFAIGILVMLLLPAVVGAQELTIISENNPPFNFVKHGSPTGSSMEIVREMLRRMNRTDTIQILPWARGYDLALSRPNVVLFSTARTNQRENLFFWVAH